MSDSLPCHLILDVRVRDTGTISVIEEFVKNVAECLDLHIAKRWDGTEVIETLEVHQSEGEFGSGISCLALLVESNITLHTRDTIKIINLDVFSCRLFSWPKVIDMAEEVFGIEETLRLTVLKR